MLAWHAIIDNFMLIKCTIAHINVLMESLSTIESKSVTYEHK